ncbi:MAG: hypothetical protein OEM82_03170 [Acidobacteriota bacterium]|nr:hypothetical protein [Acidobacteriota bacterium]MDH3529912.1 hypothetical protein [Acidobacteriota bacterium]
MNGRGKKRDRENENLLRALTVLLNLSALAMTALVGWSVFSLFKNAGAIFNSISGNFLP